MQQKAYAICDQHPEMLCICAHCTMHKIISSCTQPCGCNISHMHGHIAHKNIANIIYYACTDAYNAHVLCAESLLEDTRSKQNETAMTDADSKARCSRLPARGCAAQPSGRITGCHVDICAMWHLCWWNQTTPYKGQTRAKQEKQCHSSINEHSKRPKRDSWHVWG